MGVCVWKSARRHSNLLEEGAEEIQQILGTSHSRSLNQVLEIRGCVHELIPLGCEVRIRLQHSLRGRDPREVHAMGRLVGTPSPILL